MFSIRWKFLAILLGFSIAPLMVFFFLNYRASLRLGEDLNDIARGLMVNTTGKELQESAENYARNFGRELNRVESGLRRYAEQLRSDPAAAAADPALDFEPLDGRLRVARSGVSAASRSLPAPGDPQPPVGTTQQLPPVSRLLTIEIPVPPGAGSSAGVVAFDLDLPRMMERIRPASQWTAFVTSLLVSSSGDGPAEVLAERSVPGGIESWRIPTSAAASQAARRLAAAKLEVELRKWPQGYGTLVHDGNAWIWAYAVAPRGLAVVNLLPQRETVYRLTQSRGRLSRLYTLETLAAVGAVLLLFTLVATVRSKKMIRPFLTMVSAFQRLAQGDFSARLGTAPNDERRMVAEAFNTMAVQLEDRLRIRQALEVAREVQQAFLPDKQVSIPGADVATCVQYSEETGGDYIDVIRDGERLGIVVSDVTGHGIGAALLMATARALIRGRYGEPGGPTGLIHSVNRKLAADIGDSGRFLTLFLLEIDSAARAVQWVRAGHDPAWLFSADGSVRLLDGPGVPLGVDEDYRYQAGPQLAVRPGDLAVIGTDGIWETLGPSGDRFGKGRFEAVVRENRYRSAADICAAVLKAVNEFRAGGHQEDDVSLVAVKFTALNRA
jgi:sigma-B regulation protein RsbU (phosphoserine phosphatase)